MARGRFLSKSIAHSEQLAYVSFEADYLFTRCIPHLDVEGRMPGNPTKVFSMACPLRPELLRRMPGLLQELHNTELVIWYEINGRQYLYFPGFEEHQQGLRKNREAPSSIPEPTPESIRSRSGVGPEPSGAAPALSIKGKGEGEVEVPLPSTPPSTEEYWKPEYWAEYENKGMDVRFELVKAQRWLESNPKKRYKNLKRFLTNWMNRAVRDLPEQPKPPKMPDPNEGGYCPVCKDWCARILEPMRKGRSATVKCDHCGYSNAEDPGQ